MQTHLGIIMCLPKMHDIYRQTTILSFLSPHGCTAKGICNKCIPLLSACIVKKLNFASNLYPLRRCYCCALLLSFAKSTVHGKFLPPCSIEEIQRVQANVCKNKNYLCMHHHRILPLPFLPPSTGEGSMDVKVKTTLKVAHHGVIFFRFFALPARSSSVHVQSYMSFTEKSS